MFSILNFYEISFKYHFFSSKVGGCLIFKYLFCLIFLCYLDFKHFCKKISIALLSKERESLKLFELNEDIAEFKSKIKIYFVQTIKFHFRRGFKS